jgi:hypothetical protein
VLAALIIDFGIALWFFLGKDVNSLRDPCSTDALGSLMARMYWAFPVAGLTGLLGPAVVWFTKLMRKSNNQL